MATFPLKTTNIWFQKQRKFFCDLETKQSKNWITQDFFTGRQHYVVRKEENISKHTIFTEQTKRIYF